MESDDFSDVLDMEYLLLSDASSVTDSKQSETSCELEFLLYTRTSHSGKVSFLFVVFVQKWKKAADHMVRICATANHGCDSVSVTYDLESYYSIVRWRTVQHLLRDSCRLTTCSKYCADDSVSLCAD